MSDLEKLIRKSHYFEYRKVSPEDYKNYKLPAWIKSELTDKNLKILDYGCGFGQNLMALKKEGFINIYGVDIEENAISYLQRGV